MKMDEVENSLSSVPKYFNKRKRVSLNRKQPSGI